MKIDLHQTITNNGMTPAEFARRVGVHQSQVTRWLQRSRVPPIRAKQVATLLNVDVFDVSPELRDMVG